MRNYALAYNYAMYAQCTPNVRDVQGMYDHVTYFIRM